MFTGHVLLETEDEVKKRSILLSKTALGITTPPPDASLANAMPRTKTDDLKMSTSMQPSAPRPAVLLPSLLLPAAHLEHLVARPS